MLVGVGVLSIALGLTVTPAGASGEHTTAVLTSPLSGSSTTFTWSYEFHGNGGHSLSNVAISFCSTDILPHVVSFSPSGESFLIGDVPGGHTGFGPGIKFATTAVNGTLTVVFDQPQTAGGTINIQSHSGDGQAGDQIMTASGPGSCNPTTTTTVPATTSTVPVTTTTAPATATTVKATTTTLPSTTTTVGPVTTTTVGRATTSTAPAMTTIAPANTSTSVPTSVLGARFSADDPAADLAKTGFSGGPLVAFGLIALLLGAALVVGGKLAPAGD